jgi:hypothetical protein
LQQQKQRDSESQTHFSSISSNKFTPREFFITHSNIKAISLTQTHNSHLKYSYISFVVKEKEEKNTFPTTTNVLFESVLVTNSNDNDNDNDNDNNQNIDSEEIDDMKSFETQLIQTLKLDETDSSIPSHSVTNPHIH